ncbi:hypothetical protein CONPUDRAFT_160578 [Coniophora puteana RWD-64-598 SS2]|uniref:Uncharacterized protein n=1 Tax=Coniophora puteana (strain RWD-64-598) TaxID=741705 RepID=R7SCM3_CONPW|nr:uncharacterized protein CONPUDRAFT_160578 [Coniophora puteana RWD-64-598 SS2]EIW73916.1 hypothetical protein CONPUDRAFT_160578 [Coniophora puteana RWD-64-598 SS2]
MLSPHQALFIKSTVPRAPEAKSSCIMSSYHTKAARREVTERLTGNWYRDPAEFDPRTWSPHRRPSGDWNAFDAYALTSDNKMLITSPNAPFIPEYRNTEQELRARKDGRLGQADPFQWPTAFHPSMPWVALYPRQSYFENDPKLTFLWWTPTDEDITWSHPERHTTGTLDGTGFSRLRALLDVAEERHRQHQNIKPVVLNNTNWLKRALRRLYDILYRFRRVPGDYRSILLDVTDFQRGVMDVWAFTEWWLRIKSGFYARDSSLVEGLKKEDGITLASPMYMGCFTNEPFHAEDLYTVGIPVWIPRGLTQWTAETNSIHFVNTTRPHVVIEDYHEDGVDLRFPVLHRGKPGLLRIIAARFGYGHSAEDETSFKYHGISVDLLGTGLKDILERGTSFATSSRSLAIPPAAGPSRSKSSSKSSKSNRPAPYPRPGDKSKPNGKPNAAKEQRNKWDELVNEFWPTAFVDWTGAMRGADKSPGRVRNIAMNGGYFFPDPAMFCGVTDHSRLFRYVVNWLALREPWLRFIRINPPSLPPKAQNWRDFLNGSIWDATSFDDSGTGSASNRDKARMYRFLEPVIDAARANCEASSWVVRGTTITRQEVNALDPLLIKRLLWDICDLSFAAEVVAVDQVRTPELWQYETTAIRREILARVFPAHFGAVPDAWPSHRAGSFGVTDDELPAVLEALREVVCAWPRVSNRLGVSLEGSGLTFGTMTLEQQAKLIVLRRELCDTFVQEFFDVFGRPPVLPHVYPGSSDGSIAA